MANLFTNEEAEKAIIGLILMDDSYNNIVMQFTPADFSKPEHQKIVEMMQLMYAEKQFIDLTTLGAALLSKYDTTTANNLSLIAVADMNSDMAFMAKYHIKEYSELIKTTAMRRNMLSIVEQAKRDLTTTTEDTTSILDRTRQKLRDIIITSHSWKTISEVLLSTYETLDKRAKGEEQSIVSGIGMLDRLTTGFHRGEMTIIGARPAVGKSAIGAHIALSAAEKGYKVGICSREMTDVQYGTRIISRNSEIDNMHLRTGALEPEEWQSVSDAIRLSSNIPVNFMFTTRYIEDLRMEVQKKVDAGDLDLLMVDYLQLMQSRQRFEKDYLRVGYVSKMLKDMTVDFNISIIALAQVGRSVENTMPTLAELRGSGDIEQDADNVIFLHRPKDASDNNIFPEDREGFASIKKRGQQYILLNVAKQRQGPIGMIAVIFDPARMRYIPIERNKEQN